MPNVPDRHRAQGRGDGRDDGSGPSDKARRAGSAGRQAAHTLAPTGRPATSDLLCDVDHPLDPVERHPTLLAPTQWQAQMRVVEDKRARILGSDARYTDAYAPGARSQVTEAFFCRSIKFACHVMPIYMCREFDCANRNYLRFAMDPKNICKYASSVQDLKVIYDLVFAQ